MTAETRARWVHSSLFLFLCPTRGLDLGLLDAVLGRRHGFVRPRQHLVLPDAEVLACSVLFVVQYAGNYRVHRLITFPDDCHEMRAIDIILLWQRKSSFI